jgi:hypothetical protein
MGFAIAYVDTVLESQLNPLLPGATVYLVEAQTEEYFPGTQLLAAALCFDRISGTLAVTALNVWVSSIVVVIGSKTPRERLLPWCSFA